MNYLKALLADKRLNPVLFIGIGLKIFTLLGIAALWFFTDWRTNTSDYETETYDSISQFVLRLVLMVLVAPIMEELLFDGGFLRSKYLKLFSYIGLSLFICVIGIQWPSTILYLLFCVLSYYDYKTASEKDRLLLMRVVVNALLFSVVHLDFNNLGDMWLISLMSRFAGHLIALWLVINYKLIYAMGYHFVWNGALAFVLFSGVSFEKDPNILNEVIDTELFCIEYSETAFISPFEVRFSESNRWYCTACTFETLFEFHSWHDAKLMKQKQAGYKYDIEVNFKAGINIKDKADLFEKLSKTLIEKGVMVKE